MDKTTKHKVVGEFQLEDKYLFKLVMLNEDKGQPVYGLALYQLNEVIGPFETRTEAENEFYRIADGRKQPIDLLSEMQRILAGP